jgi:hypothetical protein
VSEITKSFKYELNSFVIIFTHLRAWVFRETPKEYLSSQGIKHVYRLIVTLLDTQSVYQQLLFAETENISTTEEFRHVVFPLLKQLGPYLHRDVILFVKICRILRLFLKKVGIWKAFSL